MSHGQTSLIEPHYCAGPELPPGKTAYVAHIETNVIAAQPLRPLKTGRLRPAWLPWSGLTVASICRAPNPIPVSSRGSIISSQVAQQKKGQHTPKAALGSDKGATFLECGCWELDAIASGQPSNGISWIQDLGFNFRKKASFLNSLCFGNR